MSESYEFEAQRFAKLLKRIRQGIPEPYEILSQPLHRVSDVFRILSNLPPNTPIWQHGYHPDYHVAAIYIAKGTGFDFSRPLMDLYHNKVYTMDDFKKAWFTWNAGEFNGDLPQVSSSFTMNARRKQRSYIVADTAHEHLESKLPDLPVNSVDRTHLIPFPIIGIENSPGLLIDYDSYLNRNEMNDYENRIMELTKHEDLVWITSVYPSNKGLKWRYLIYDQYGQKISQHTWFDDRWTYYWYYDKRQEYIGKEA